MPGNVSIWDFSQNNEFLLIAITGEQLVNISNNSLCGSQTDSDRE